MKSFKSYICEISGNNNKINYISENLEIISNLSWFIFNLKKQFGIHWWFNQKKLYHQCRKMFPELNSKIIQNFIKFSYSIKKGIKIPKNPVKSSIFLDQSFKIDYSEKTKYTNFWLKFHKKYFPLFGLNILRNIDLSKIKLIQIFKRNNKFYCKLVEVKENLDINNLFNKNNNVGCDINYKRAVLSNNTFFQIKKLAHRKIEHRKYKQFKRNLNNFNKDFLHKLTSKISKNLQDKGIDVLVLEDLRNLRKSASKKLGTSKGKMINYIINSFPYSMFQNFLEYKCLDLGIRVEKVNPAYTSKTCSKCGSINTSRSRQQDFKCLNCGFQLDADLNGSRNIESRYTHS